MADERTDIADLAQGAPAVDSHGRATKPSPMRPFPAARDQAQKGLDVCGVVPLHLKPVVTYAEAAALGIAPERTLRRLVAVGHVKRAVLRAGRSVRFVVRDLLDELRGAEG